MKALKIIGVVIVVIIAVPLIASLVVSNEFSLDRSVEIERSAEDVFDYLLYLENHNNFTVWAQLDPDMETEIHGADGTVGAVSTWSGNEDVGRGEQEITRIVDGERIEHEVRFFEPFESTADAYIIIEAVSDDRTRVTWGFDSKMPRPMNLLLIVMDLEDAIGEDYQTGLNNLKAVLEAEIPDEPEEEESI